MNPAGVAVRVWFVVGEELIVTVPATGAVLATVTVSFTVELVPALPSVA